MDMFEGVGRRLDQREGSFLNIGSHSLNGRERNVLFRNNGDGTFLDVGFVTGADRVEDGRGLSIFDYDGDGRQDLLIRNYRQPAELLHNVGRERTGSSCVSSACARTATRSGEVRVRTAAGWQMREVHAGSGYLSGQSLVQHFGLGDAAVADEVVIEWPSGARTVLRGLAADRRHQVVEDADRPTVVSGLGPARPDRTPRVTRARPG
jgi:hypothetical protein